MKSLMASFRVLWLVLGVAVFSILALLFIGPAIGSTRPAVGTLKREGSIVIAAIENYSRDHGVLPDSLDQLVPQYLPKLKEVEYCYQKYYKWPHRLFSGTRKSDWAYKTSRDKKSYALGVEATDRTYYDSKTGEWEIWTNMSFANYDKAP